MRLSPHEQQAILGAIGRRDATAEVFLFGSRVDDAAQGGDIDLLVLSRTIGLMDKLDILGELHRGLGDRRIDLLIYPDRSEPFVRIAVEEGVRL